MNIVFRPPSRQIFGVKQPDDYGWRERDGRELDICMIRATRRGSDSIKLVVQTVMEEIISIAPPGIAGADPNRMPRFDAGVCAPIIGIIPGQTNGQRKQAIPIVCM